MKGGGILLVLVALAACEDAQGPRLEAGDLEGEWTFSFEETEAGCEPDKGGGFEFAIHIDHTGTDILSANVYVKGRYVATDQEAWSVVQGVFDLDRRTFDLTLWGAQQFEGAPRIVVTGEVDDRPAVTGQWWEIDGQVLYEQGCSGTVDGERIS